MLRYFLFIAVLGTLSFVGIHQVSLHSNESIQGDWEELSWNYIKSDKKIRIEDDAVIKYELASHLVVHQFEHWRILSNNRMEFKDSKGLKHSCSWYLKGRGNILELVHPNNTKETYTIKNINDSILEMHVETAVHARGVLKIVLLRKHEEV